MYCGKCGKKIPDGYEYCMYCGKKIGEVHNQKKFNKKAILFIVTILILILLACSWVFIFMPKFSFPKKYYSSLKGMGNESYYELIDQSNYKYIDFDGKQDETGKYKINGDLLNFTNSDNTTESYKVFEKYLYTQTSCFDETVPEAKTFDKTLEQVTQYSSEKFEYHSDGTFIRYTKTFGASDYQPSITGNYERKENLIIYKLEDGKSFYDLVVNNKVYNDVYIQN